MPWAAKIRWIVVLPLLLTAAVSTRLAAQDDLNSDPNDAPLGDVASSLRKKTPPSQSVIDDDNLSKVMEQAESRHAPGSALRFLMAGESKEFRVSAPDVTCSLAFTSNVKALLSNQYSQMELPAGELSKLEGPATIEGDALIVALYNRTDWRISELVVAITVVKKNGVFDAMAIDGAEGDVRPEKKPDLTMIYRMRAGAAPSETAVFSAPLKMELAPDDEWHWAIVQARGYPPQSYAGASQPSQEANRPAEVQSISEQSTSAQPTVSPAVAGPQNSPILSVPHNP